MSRSVGQRCSRGPSHARSGAPGRGGVLGVLPTASASAAHVCRTLAARGCPGFSSTLAESSQSPDGGQPRALWSGSDFPFLGGLLPRRVCGGFSSTLVRVLGLRNYYLTGGSGLNWLRGRLVVLRSPANVNVHHVAQGGCLPLPWPGAESGPHGSEVESHGLGCLSFSSTGSSVEGCGAPTLIAFPTLLFKKRVILIIHLINKLINKTLAYTTADVFLLCVCEHLCSSVCPLPLPAMGVQSV